jgi:3-oxoacyl-[acyl-carrier protein] reductase
MITQKNSLVTGGVHGIGRAIVEELSSRHDNVFVIDVVDPTHEAVRQLHEKGIFYYQANVSDLQSLSHAFQSLNQDLDQTPGKNLDILVNNAGIVRDGMAIRLSEQEWDAVLEVNLKGAFFCAQKALQRMIKYRAGYMVNISSVVGLHGNPGQVNYAASKAGLIAMTKTLAQEYGGRGILVNAIAPGFIQTAMTDRLPEQARTQALSRIALKRFGTPHDVAAAVSFLTSGSADYITGQILEVSGGMF